MRENLGGILIVAGFLIAVGIASYIGARHPSNFGFGPEWDCVKQARGDPICVKRIAGEKP